MKSHLRAGARARNSARRGVVALITVALIGGSVLVGATGAGATTIGNITVGHRPAGIAFTPDGTRGYVASYADNSVSVLDIDPSSPARNTVIATVGVGTAPGFIAIDPAGSRAYVSDTGSNTVTVIAIDPGGPDDNEVVDTIPVNAFPGGIGVTPDGTRLYVSSAGNNAATTSTVSVVDVNPADASLATYDRVIATIPVGSQLSVLATQFGLLFGGLLAISPNGAVVYVANAGADSLSVINAAPGTPHYNQVVTTIPLARLAASEPGSASDNPLEIKFAPNGLTAYVNIVRGDMFDSEMDVVDTQSNTVVHRVMFTTPVAALAVTPDGARVFASVGGSVAPGSVHVIDTATNTDTSTITLGGGANDIGLVSEGGYGQFIYVSDFGNVPASVPPVGQTVRWFPVPSAGDASAAGTVTDEATGNPLAGVAVQLCGTGANAGTCTNTVTAEDGTYHVDGLIAGSVVVTASAADPGLSLGGPTTVSVASGQTTTVDFALTGPAPLPPGTDLTGLRPNPGGLPLLYWQTDSTLSATNCAGGTGTWSVSATNSGTGQVDTRSGAFDENPVDSGNYDALVPALYPLHGDAKVTMHFDCPDSSTSDSGFDLYVDPSGSVVDTHANPIAGATVTLLTAPSSTGPFSPVPDGSTFMSPANRRNPDTSAIDGGFGWDVLAGYYRVRVSKAGCVSPTNLTQGFVDSGVLTIPPPVTNLQLVLDCTVRTPSSIVVQAAENPTAPNKTAKFNAMLSPVPSGLTTGRGTMTFTDNGVPLLKCTNRPISSTGRATCAEKTPPGGGPHVIVATYSGNPAVAASSSSPMIETFTQKPKFTSSKSLYVGVGLPFTFTVTAIGYPDPTSITLTAVPPAWVSFTDNGDGTATLSGTPPLVGSFRVKLSTTTSSGTAAQSVAIAVHP